MIGKRIRIYKTEYKITGLELDNKRKPTGGYTATRYDGYKMTFKFLTPVLLQQDQYKVID